MTTLPKCGIPPCSAALAPSAYFLHLDLAERWLIVERIPYSWGRTGWRVSESWDDGHRRST